MRTLRATGWILAFLLMAGAAGAQDVQVLASVSESTIGSSETVSFSIEIRGSAVSEVRTPDPPETEGLTLAQRFPSTSRNISLVNGQVSQSVRFTWVYRPIREGNARLGPTQVQVGDRSYETTAIQVTVVPQGQRPARPGTAPSTQQQQPATSAAPAPNARDLFIRVVPGTQSAVRGEQVTLRYDLYFREGIQLRQSRLTDSWDAEGFWREDLDVDARPVPQVVVEDGLRYNRITLKRAAIFPTRSGELTVDPLKIESEAVLPLRSRDPFADFFSLRSRFTPVELASPPLSLDVAPLPPGAPDGFEGAVGEYTLTTRWDRTELEVGESLQLSVVIRGSGNFATLPTPVLEVPTAFEQYEPQVNVDLDRSGSRLRGSKTYRYVLVPRANGTFQIPPVRFVYFDPTASAYRTRTSEGTAITVTGSPGDIPVARATAGGLPVDDVAAPIRTSDRWSPVGHTPLHRRPWVALLLLLPALSLGFLWVAHRRREAEARDPAAARRRRSGPLARKYLQTADEHLEAGRAPAFFEALERAVLGFIGNRLDVAEQGLTRERLAATLAQTGVAADTIQSIVEFLDDCDRGRFAPIKPSSEEMAERREQAADLLVRIDDETAASR